VWDAKSGKEQPSFFGGSNTLVFSPDSRRIASLIGRNASRIAIYDCNTGQPRLILPGHDGIVPALAFSPDGRRLASGSFDNTVKVWDVAPEQELRLLFACGPSAPLLSALAFLHPPIRTFTFDSRVNGVAFSPDGKRLAAGGMDRIVKIWDTTTWQEILTLRDPTGGISCLAYSPDSQRIATGGTDATVKLWDAATGNVQRILHGHTHWVSAVVFSPDSQRVASSSFDGTVKLWNAGASVAKEWTSE
jgi:WD40 repeat protein